MPQAVFKAGEKRRLSFRLHIDHPVGIKSGLSKSGSEEIRPGQAPDDVSCTARHDAGDEESRRCCMQRSRSPSGDLVKSAERQPALWKAPIDVGNAKRQDAGCALSDWPDPGDPGAQVIEGGARKRRRHQRPSHKICSLFVLLRVWSQSSMKVACLMTGSA